MKQTAHARFAIKSWDRSDGSATYVGLERVAARIKGKSGTFVLARRGVFESAQAKESYAVIPGSGPVAGCGPAIPSLALS